MSTLNATDMSVLRPEESEVRRIQIVGPYGCVVCQVNVGAGCVVQVPLDEAVLLCAMGKAKAVDMNTPLTPKAELTPKVAYARKPRRAAGGVAPVPTKYGHLEALLEKNAPEIEAKLDDLEPAELAILGAMEAAGKHRKGVLEAIEAELPEADED